MPPRRLSILCKMCDMIHIRYVVDMQRVLICPICKNIGTYRDDREQLALDDRKYDGVLIDDGTHHRIPTNR